MSSVYLAIVLDDDSVALMEFVTASRGSALPHGARRVDDDSWERDPTDENIFAELFRAFPATDSLGLPVPQPVRYKRVARADIPSDRTYRNALRHTDAGFHFDMPQARQMHVDAVRRMRTAQLGELDKEWTRATGQGKKTEADAIEVQRQALRDAPQTLNVDAAQTIEELKAIWPDGLPRD